MTPDPSGGQEPEKARFHFPKGQSVCIVEGAFTEYIGTVSESDGCLPTGDLQTPAVSTGGLQVGCIVFP